MKRSALLLLVSILMLSGCSVARWERTAIARQNEFHVTLEQRQEQDAVVQRHYNHPSRVDLADMTRLLTDLTASQEGGLLQEAEQQPVFQAAEVERLAPALQDALAKATPDQRVRFVSFNLEKSVLISFSRKTEGVLFVDSAGYLNVAFNGINVNRRPGESSAMNPTFAEEDPLTIRSAESTLNIPPYATARGLDNGKPAPLWLLVDLQQLRHTPRTVVEPVHKKVKKGVPAPAPAKKAVPVVVKKPARKVAPEAEKPSVVPAEESFTVEVVEEKPQQTPVLAEPEMEPVVEAVAETIAETPAVDVPAAESQEAVPILDYYQELLDEGLITAEDFEKKKKEMMRGGS